MLNPAFKNELSLLRKSLKLINKPRHADTSGLLHSFKEPSLAMRPNRTHPVVRSLTARWEVCKHCTSWNIPKPRGSDDISLPSTSQFHNCTKCLVYASFSTHFVVYRLFFKAPRRRIFTFTDYTFPAPTLSSSLWGSERLVLDQLISYRRSPPSCQNQPWCSGYGCFHTHILFFSCERLLPGGCTIRTGLSAARVWVLWSERGPAHLVLLFLSVSHSCTT